MNLGGFSWKRAIGLSAAKARLSRRIGIPLNLNDLLTGKGIDSQQVLVLRHRPHETELNKMLPWLAARQWLNRKKA